MITAKSRKRYTARLLLAFAGWTAFHGVAHPARSATPGADRGLGSERGKHQRNTATGHFPRPIGRYVRGLQLETGDECGYAVAIREQYGAIAVGHAAKPAVPMQSTGTASSQGRRGGQDKGSAVPVRGGTKAHVRLIDDGHRYVDRSNQRQGADLSSDVLRRDLCSQDEAGSSGSIAGRSSDNQPDILLLVISLVSILAGIALCLQRETTMKAFGTLALVCGGGLCLLVARQTWAGF